MQKLFIQQTHSTPEIHFSPDENIFIIQGRSTPEDVRAMYYPVVEWTKALVNDTLDGKYKSFNAESPLDFKIDLSYFNSSSAKFLYDILMEIQRLFKAGIPVNVSWYYDEEDTDMKEAGFDISQFVEMEFKYIPKLNNT